MILFEIIPKILSVVLSEISPDIPLQILVRSFPGALAKVSSGIPAKVFQEIHSEIHAKVSQTVL